MFTEDLGTDSVLYDFGVGNVRVYASLDPHVFSLQDLTFNHELLDTVPSHMW